MIRISEVVYDLLTSDEVALEALRAGVLNLSAYAQRILPLVQKTLYKDVSKGSIVTALSRLAPRIIHVPALRAAVRIHDMNIKSPLSEITYEKTSQISQKIARLVSEYSAKGLFTVTQGVGEITLIFAAPLKSTIIKDIGVEPRGQYDDLASVTVRFSEVEYIEVPNMIFSLVAAIAAKRINLIEIVSTYTEISFIVRQKDLKATLEVIKNNFLT